MFLKINFQYLLSYFGIIPYIFIIIDKSFSNKFDIIMLNQFSIYYTIIIFVFIGSTNWNLKEKIPNYLVLYGFIPSFISLILIILTLFSIKTVIILNILIFILMMQLFLDLKIIYRESIHKFIFYKVRLPLTLIIIISLTIILT